MTAEGTDQTSGTSDAAANGTQDADARLFTAHRDLLMGIAYRVLGRVTDAEDVLQEAWLRWSTVPAGTVRDPKAFLVAVTTRLAIDRLRRAQARRESYVGEWLPEPLLTAAEGDPDADVAEQVIRAESVSLALLVVLETLSPLERAVLVLRDVFGFSYPEVAAALDRQEPAVRQLAARARGHVRERRPRFDVDPERWRRVNDRFVQACATGNVSELIDLLSPDVRLVPDGGGKVVAPRRAIAGAAEVARFVFNIMKLGTSFTTSAGVAPGTPTEYRFVTANSGPAIQVVANDRPFVHFQISVRSDDRVGQIFLVVNPEKLNGVMSREPWVPRP